MKLNESNEVIILEKRGCDFFKNDTIDKISDVGNYRVGIYNKYIVVMTLIIIEIQQRTVKEN